MKRPQSLSSWVLVLGGVAGLVYTAIVGNQPLLGLDLQGGVSVALKSAEPADEETLQQTVEIIRSRVDGLGVAEPEISLQGETIVVHLPGVDEQQRALDLVGQTAELRFRPVLAPLGPSVDIDDLITQLTVDEDTETTVEDDTEEGFAPGVRGRQATTTASTTATTTSTTSTATPDETAPDETTVTAPEPISAEQIAATTACGIPGTTPPEDNLPENYVVLADKDGLRYCLGPSKLSGEALETADVAISGVSTFTVNPVFREGPEGIDAFNLIAAECFSRLPTCPTQALAIVLDERVVSAPSINAQSFQRDSITISGGFDEEAARDLALVLRYGALPVELIPQAVQTVSATIGSDALRAGIISGSIGLVLVGAYLLFYYRLAGLVAIGGIVISSMLLWTIIAWLGENNGLAITLAGVVGLIVSIGVAADSNIVYFETVKDIAREGRRSSTAIERGYRSAISTIIKADTVSLIGAGLLYFLTVGAVKGFAFYLGLATLLDLAVSTWFMRPALAWLARLPAVEANPRLIGLTVVGEERKVPLSRRSNRPNRSERSKS